MTKNLIKNSKIYDPVVQKSYLYSDVYFDGSDTPVMLSYPIDLQDSKVKIVKLEIDLIDDLDVLPCVTKVEAFPENMTLTLFNVADGKIYRDPQTMKRDLISDQKIIEGDDSENGDYKEKKVIQINPIETRDFKSGRDTQRFFLRGKAEVMVFFKNLD